MNRSDEHDPTTYEIRVAGLLHQRWAARFDGFVLRHEADGTTVLSGSIVDQAALHGLLKQVRDLGLPLVSVIRPENEPFTPGTGAESTDHEGDPRT